jgi:hypothetical protein
MNDETVVHVLNTPSGVTAQALKDLRRIAGGNRWAQCWRLHVRDSAPGVAVIMGDDEYKDSRGVKREVRYEFQTGVHYSGLGGGRAVSAYFSITGFDTLVRTLRAGDVLSVGISVGGGVNEYMRKAGLTADHLEIDVRRRFDSGKFSSWGMEWTSNPCPVGSMVLAVKVVGYRDPAPILAE